MLFYNLGKGSFVDELQDGLSEPLNPKGRLREKYFPSKDIFFGKEKEKVLEGGRVG